jgi:hypothetical protein
MAGAVGLPQFILHAFMRRTGKLFKQTNMLLKKVLLKKLTHYKEEQKFSKLYGTWKKGGGLCLEEPATGPNSVPGESSRKPLAAYL